MKTFLCWSRTTSTRCLFSALAAALALLPATVRAQITPQIFVAYNSGNTIGDYNALTGAVINSVLIPNVDAPFTAPNSPMAIAATPYNLFIASNNTTSISEYTTSGTSVNSTLVSGVYAPTALAVSGPDLFVVTSQGEDTLGEYSAITGAAVNATLVSDVSSTGIAVSGSNLFVANSFTGTVSEYDTTTGAVINASLVSGLNNLTGIALSGSNLFVESAGASDTIGEYDSTTGATVNATLISGLNDPIGLAELKGNLYVLDSDGTIGEFSTSGATINATLVTGLSNVKSFAVVPEPSTWALLAGGAAALLAVFRRRERKTA